MKTTRSDEIGYCVQVGHDAIKVFKMNRSDFENHGCTVTWVKTLLGEGDKSIYIEGIYTQFVVDPTIDIFIDADGIGKGYPALATTNNGIVLRGNFVALGSNKGETILLTEVQVKIVVSELGFYQDYGGIEIIDTTGASEHLAPEDHPQVLKDLLGGLIGYCLNKETQLLTLASNPYNPSEEALVMCLHGEPEYIAECHQLLRKFVEGKDRIIN